jgi:hypothetical protein
MKYIQTSRVNEALEQLFTTRLRIASHIPAELSPLQKNSSDYLRNNYKHLVVYNTVVNVVVRDYSTFADTIIAPEVLRLGAVDDVEPKHMLVAWQRKRMLRSTSTTKRTPMSSSRQAKGVLSIDRGNKQHCPHNEKQI